MLIGFDFDNTIVSYDSLFHKISHEEGHIDKHFPCCKTAIRDRLRQLNQEDVWTAMQGYVYGARLQEAELFPNVLDAMQKLLSGGHSICVVSHKTKFPYLGDRYDLHAAAHEFIIKKLPELAPDSVYFELTKEEKLARIAALKCDIFIDDLPEILLHPDFPAATSRYLFDPQGIHDTTDTASITRFSDWSTFAVDS